jgi:tetratricopeptide (TPR) repeat protein
MVVRPNEPRALAPLLIRCALTEAALPRRSQNISGGLSARVVMAGLIACGALASRPASARVPADPGVRRVLHGSDSLFAAGRLDSAAAICADVVRQARAAHDRNVLLESRLRQAAAWLLSDHLAPGEAAAREALALAGALDDSANVRRSLRWLGYALLKQGRLNESAIQYERLLPLATAANDPLSEGLARGSLAYRDLLAGRLREAESGYRMACACLDSAHDVRSKLWNLVGLARVQGALGEYAAARSSYEAIERTAAANGALVPRADALNNLGTLEYQIGDPARAQNYWRRAIPLYRQAGAVEPRLSTEINLCIADRDLGHLDDAALRLDSLAAASVAGGFRAQQTSALTELADLRIEQGRPLEAARIFRRIIEDVRPEETRRVSSATRGLARSLAAAGHAD